MEKRRDIWSAASRVILLALRSILAEYIYNLAQPGWSVHPSFHGFTVLIAKVLRYLHCSQVEIWCSAFRNAAFWTMIHSNSCIAESLLVRRNKSLESFVFF